MILESVEDRINIVESGLRVLAFLFGVCDLTVAVADCFFRS